MLPFDDSFSFSSEPVEALLDGFPFEHVPALVAYIDASGINRRMSAAWEQWCDVSRDELVGRHYVEVALRLFGDEHFGRIDAAVRRAFAGECIQVEDAFPDPRGRRYVRASYTPNLDVSGAVRGVLLLVYDLSDLKRAEQTAIENERRYRAVVEGAPVKMWLNRPDGTAEWYNARWRAYTGQLANLEGTTIAEVIHPDDRTWYRPLREAALSGGTPYEGKIRLRRAADGMWRRHHCRVSPLREEGGTGKIWAWVGVAMDVHESTTP